MTLGPTGLRAPLPDWMNGAAWQEGLDEEEIRAIEERRGISFPDDYRCFLRLLHAQERRPSFYKSGSGRTVIDKLWVFYDWRRDEDAIDRARDRLSGRILEGVRDRKLWLRSWGPKPASAAAQRRRIEALVRKAPALIPFSAGNFVVSNRSSPVYSLHPRTFEFWISGATFAEFLFDEFQDSMSPATAGAWERALPRARRPTRDLPFWSEISAWCAERLP